MNRGRLAGTAAIASIAALAAASPASAQKHYGPGVSDTGIKIGQSAPFSGPVSLAGELARGEIAYIRMIDDQGGVNGRKIDLISLDDAYTPARTLEQTRKLVEQDGVAFIFGTIGTPTNLAIEKYLNDRKIPQLLIATGAERWGDFKRFPWTMAFNPTYRAEARVYAKYFMKHRPAAKFAVLYQNDDFGSDYLDGLKDVFGGDFDKIVVKKASYEVSDPTVDSQIVALQSSGADILLSVTTPKASAQAIRKVHDLGWKPTFLLSNIAASIGAVFRPAGLDKSIGIVTASAYKDPSDPRWQNDDDMKAYTAFMAKYMPKSDPANVYYLWGFAEGQALVQILKQCGDDLTRENILKQATNLHQVKVAVLFPGITMNTSPTNYHPITQLQLQRFDGTRMVPFGEVISAE